jgi:Icc-related predicted phosphoesterase
MKIVCISDTHNKHHLFAEQGIDIPEADCIVHSGDFSNKEHHMLPFLEWYSALPHEHKILIAGNHDYALKDYASLESFKQVCNMFNITFLHDSGIEINGLNFWGSPWSISFGNYPFMGDDLELQIRAWDHIPDYTDVLLTHGPAKGLGDEVYQTYGDEKDNHVGSCSLRSTLERLPNLKLRVWEYYKKELREPEVFTINKKD